MAVETKTSADMKFSFAAEVYTNISAANVFISYDNGKDGGVVSSVKVKLHKDFLIISISETKDNVVHQLKLTAPENYFIPLSFYSVHSNMSLFDETESGLLVAEYVNGNLNEPSSNKMSISFRVQVNSSPSDPQSTTSGMKTFREPESDVSYKVCCRQCRAALRDGPISFKKVVPVLGDPMEVTESFFCHAHHDNKHPVPPQQEDDLLFTYNFYRISCFHNDRLSFESGNRNVYCAGCRSFLGMKQSRNVNCDDNVLLCFKDKVVFSASDEVQPVWPSVTDTSLSLLLDIIEKTQMNSMTCKLVLEVKVSPSSSKCLLLWVMSLNMKLYRTQHGEPSLQLEEKLTLEPVMKVLYHEARPNSEAIRSWMHQFAVDYYIISDTMMQEILKILSESSVGIPICKDMTPSFNVGYLPVRI